MPTVTTIEAAGPAIQAAATARIRSWIWNVATSNPDSAEKTSIGASSGTYPAAVLRAPSSSPGPVSATATLAPMATRTVRATPAITTQVIVAPSNRSASCRPPWRTAAR